MATLSSAGAAAKVAFTKAEIEKAASDIRTLKGNHEDAINGIGKVVDSLQGRWEGDAQNAFYNSFHNMNQTFAAFAESLETFAKFAEDYVREMSDLDARFGKSIT